MTFVRSHGWRARVQDQRWRRAARNWVVADDDELSRSTLVVAPHPDDDVLGCGGTIARKRSLGVDVAVVVLTDGALANRDILDAAELAELRGREEIASLDVLGVGPHRAWFLGFRDGGLRKEEEAAAVRLVPILEEVRPAEVLVTARDDGHPDHEAAYRVVRRALTSIGSDAAVVDYPVWWWQHWPWGPLPINGRGGVRKFPRRMKAALAAARTGEPTAGFTWAVPVTDVLEQKRAAIAAHASQVTRFGDDPRWESLLDEGGGEFLERFLTAYELFRRQDGRRTTEGGLRPPEGGRGPAAEQE
ncbi:MAG TPA: PIG-L deacetylase family protein [Acidimicrobiia bacterium]|nr:PIG-L deacetylase family protein [Acidimicrobiia bacterium]